MAHSRYTLWDYLAWISLGYITLWLVLKVTGVINTPLLLEYSPLFGAVYLAGHLVHQLKRATEDIKEIKNRDIPEVRNEVKALEQRIFEVDKDLHFIKGKIQ